MGPRLDAGVAGLGVGVGFGARFGDGDDAAGIGVGIVVVHRMRAGRRARVSAGDAVAGVLGAGNIGDRFGEAGVNGSVGRRLRGDAGEDVGRGDAVGAGVRFRIGLTAFCFCRLR